MTAILVNLSTSEVCFTTDLLRRPTDWTGLGATTISTWEQRVPGPSRGSARLSPDTQGETESPPPARPDRAVPIRRRCGLAMSPGRTPPPARRPAPSGAASVPKARPGAVRADHRVDGRAQAGGQFHRGRGRVQSRPVEPRRRTGPDRRPAVRWPSESRTNWPLTASAVSPGSSRRSMAIRTAIRHRVDAQPLFNQSHAERRRPECGWHVLCLQQGGGDHALPRAAVRPCDKRRSAPSLGREAVARTPLRLQRPACGSLVRRHDVQQGRLGAYGRVRQVRVRHAPSTSSAA